MTFIVKINFLPHLYFFGCVDIKLDFCYNFTEWTRVENPSIISCSVIVNLLQMSLFCACVHVCFCKAPSLECLSVILRHRWGSSQPVSFIIPTNYSKSSFQSSCSSLSPSSPSFSYTYPSIHHTYALFISFILPSECTNYPTAPSSFYRLVFGVVLNRIE